MCILTNNLLTAVNGSFVWRRNWWHTLEPGAFSRSTCCPAAYSTVTTRGGKLANWPETYGSGATSAFSAFYHLHPTTPISRPQKGDFVKCQLFIGPGGQIHIDSSSFFGRGGAKTVWYERRWGGLERNSRSWLWVKNNISAVIWGLVTDSVLWSSLWLLAKTYVLERWWDDVMCCGEVSDRLGSSSYATADIWVLKSSSSSWRSGSDPPQFGQKTQQPPPIHITLTTSPLPPIHLHLHLHLHPSSNRKLKVSSGVWRTMSLRQCF